MTTQSRSNLRKRKKKNTKRLKHTNQPSRKPVLQASNIRYEISGKINATSHGGIGIIHSMNQALKIPEILNNHVKLLKYHNPYFESDHILNMAYNLVCGGRYIEDLESLRTDDAYMDGLGATRIPDPTTAGDFLRRFDTNEKISALQDANIETIKNTWDISNGYKKRPIGILDIDGTLKNTTGEYKEKSNFTYKKGFGFSALILTEVTTGVHLYTVNRGGEVLSQSEAEKWIMKAIDEMQEHFDKIIVRGDSA